MAATANEQGQADGTEVVKWYTRARKFPQLIGKTPDGTTIWGGPYTYTQVIVGVGIVAVGSKTTSMWGHFGLIGNILLLLGVAYGTVLVVGRLPIGSRNPLSVGSGALRAWTSPAKGRLGGAPVQMRKPHTARSRLVVAPTPGTPAADPSPTPVESSRSRLRLPRVRWSARSRVDEQELVTAAAVSPALSGVQKLLASTGPDEREDY